MYPPMVIKTTTVDSESVGQTLLWVLGLWAILAFSQPAALSGQTIIIGGSVACGMILLTHPRVKVPFPWAPTLLVVCALASSILQSSDGGFRYAIFYALLTFSAVIFASCTTASQGLRILDAASKLLAVITTAMLVLVPSEAIEDRWPNAGALIGPFIHKNILGTLIMTLYRNRGAWLWTWIAVYLGLIALTASSTALALCMIALAVRVLTALSTHPDKHERGRRLVLSGLTLLFALIAIWLLIDRVLELLGRDRTLSGRNRIWGATIDAWRQKPVFGYGWHGAYEEGSQAARQIESVTGWLVPSSHSGYLSMLLQMGLIGFLLLIVAVGQAAVRTWRRISVDYCAQWAFQIVIVFAINNAVDSRLDSTIWFLLVAIIVWFRPNADNNNHGSEQETVNRSLVTSFDQSAISKAANNR